jgi:hypothetical protein
MVKLPGEVGLDAFFRREERWDVMLERGVEGGKAGREGVRRPYLGSRSG